MRAGILYVGLSVMLAGLTGSPAVARPAGESGESDRRAFDSRGALALDAVASGILRRTNALREANSRSQVATAPALMKTARDFARYMAKSDKYGHHADGRGPSERAKDHGYQYCIILENIAYQYDSRGFEDGQLAQLLVTGWKNSPAHRRNMLDPDVTQTGVAVARSPSSGIYYAVQLFGRPESERIQFQVSNRSDREIHYAMKDRDGKHAFVLPPRFIRTHDRCWPGELEFSLDGQERRLDCKDGATYVLSEGSSGRLGLAVR